MTKKVVTEIFCDQCKKDLLISPFSGDYRIILGNESMGSTKGFSYAIEATKHFDEDKHFCNIKCLKTWINENIKGE